MIDVHCHLEHEDLRNRIEEIISECKKELKAIITSSPHPRDFEYTVFLNRKFKNFVFCSIGLHPEYIGEFNEETLKYFKNLVKSKRDEIVSIGEIGLDYFWVKDENLRERQRIYFEEIIRIAKDLNKPVTVHIREAYEDAIKILERVDYQKVHLHMFGGEKFIDKVLANEWKISVGPILLRSKTHKKIVKKVPLEKIMLETDAPWMKIENRSSFPTDVKIVAEKIAEIKKKELNEVEEITDRNSVEFFSLKLFNNFNGTSYW